MTKNKFNFILYLTFTLLIFNACKTEEADKGPLTIAISKGIPESSYQKYYDFLKNADSTIILVEMYGKAYDSAMIAFDNCDALLLTGGADVHPSHYGETFDSTLCGIADLKRDSIELSLIEKAFTSGKPILGICRGEQILNVYFGGSLYYDIPSNYDTTVDHRLPGYQKVNHYVNIEQDSWFYTLVGTASDTTNSNHHQAVKEIGNGLKAVAFTEDGLIEAIELKNRPANYFLLGVQWHPEHMDFKNPLAGNIAKRFIEAGYQSKD